MTEFFLIHYYTSFAMFAAHALRVVARAMLTTFTAKRLTAWYMYSRGARLFTPRACARSKVVGLSVVCRPHLERDHGQQKFSSCKTFNLMRCIPPSGGRWLHLSALCCRQIN